MIKLILTIILFCIALSGFTQKTDIEILSNEKNIGKVIATGQEIQAIEYNFPERIHHSYIDTTSNRLTIQLRGVRNEKWLHNKGHIIQYDLANRKIQWTKKVAYQVDNYEQFGSTIVKTSGGKSYLLNSYNGEPLWEIKNALYHINSVYKIGIGYKVKTMSGITNTLEGINLSDGKEVWKREVSRDYSWNNLFYLNDSTLMAVASGLHTINIKDGTGWDYDAKTGKKDYKEAAVVNALGVVAGILTGTFVTSTGANLVRDVVSNVIADSTNFYIASKEKIAKIDKKKGRVIWSSTLPEKETSKSTIFTKDGKIYMVNKGFAYMGYRKLDFGTPFFAAFDQNTGKELFLNLMIDDKKGVVEDFKLDNNFIYFLFKNRIDKYNLETGLKVKTKEFNMKELGELSGILGNQVFLPQPDSTYKSYNLLDTNRINFVTVKNKIITFDKDLTFLEQKEMDNIWIYYLKSSDYKFIANASKTIILDENNKIVAALSATNKSTLIGSKLYDFTEKSFLVIDLEAILKKY